MKILLLWLFCANNLGIINVIAKDEACLKANFGFTSKIESYLSCSPEQVDPFQLLTEEEKEIANNYKLKPEIRDMARQSTYTDVWGYIYNWKNESDREWYVLS